MPKITSTLLRGTVSVPLTFNVPGSPFVTVKLGDVVAHVSASRDDAVVSTFRCAGTTPVAKSVETETLDSFDVRELVLHVAARDARERKDETAKAVVVRLQKFFVEGPDPVELIAALFNAKRYAEANEAMAKHEIAFGDSRLQAALAGNK